MSDEQEFVPVAPKLPQVELTQEQVDAVIALGKAWQAAMQQFADAFIAFYKEFQKNMTDEQREQFTLADDNG